MRKVLACWVLIKNQIALLNFGVQVKRLASSDGEQGGQEKP